MKVKDRCDEASRPQELVRQKELALEERGNAVDVRERLRELDKRSAEKLGSMDRTVYDHLEYAADGERITVVMWARIELPLAPYEKSADRRSDEPPRGEARINESLRGPVDDLYRELDRHGVSAAMIPVATRACLW